MKNNTPDSIGLFILGGAAYKIAHGLSEVDMDTTITPTLSPLYVDTSGTETQYILKGYVANVIRTDSGLTGSGGDRSHNLQAIKSQLPGIVAKYLNENPDIKIVKLLFSSGGGSGSTLAFVALEELLASGMSVICYISNTPNSLHRAINAVAATTSINNLAIKHGVVVPVKPYDTTVHKSFKASDHVLIQDLVCVSTLLSSTNIGVDDGDRRVVLNPSLGVREVTSPGVRFLTLHTGYNYKPNYPVQSVLTYCLPGSNDDIGTSAVNMFSGILTDALRELYCKNGDAISLILTYGDLNDWVEKMNGVVDKYKRAVSSGYHGKSINITSSVTTDVDNDGFVS